jgi:hypothetical protein
MGTYAETLEAKDAIAKAHGTPVFAASTIYGPVRFTITHPSGGELWAPVTTIGRTKHTIRGRYVFGYHADASQGIWQANKARPYGQVFDSPGMERVDGRPVTAAAHRLFADALGAVLWPYFADNPLVDDDQREATAVAAERRAQM